MYGSLPLGRRRASVWKGITALQHATVDLERIRPLRIASLIVIGLVIGILSGLLGIGGGSLLVPAMVFLLGMNQHRAHGTSLAVIGLTVLFSVLIYNSDSQVDWIVAAELAVGGVIGAALGAKIACLLSARKLRRYFGLLLVFIGIRMLYDVVAAYAGTHAVTAHVAVASPVSSGGGFVVVLVGVATGILSGLLGVGGGIIMIPAMVLLLGMSQKMAQGISLAVIIPVSVSGAVIHARHGNVNFGVGIPLAIGGVLGGIVGANAALNASPMILRGAFGVLMLILGIASLIRRPVARPACPTDGVGNR